MDTLMTTHACTLPTTERPLRLAEFDELFTTHLVRLDADRDRVRLHLRGDVGLRARVLDLTAREARCCSFFDFTVAGSDADVDLGISVPPARRDILDALTTRAAEVSGLASASTGTP